MTSTNALTIIVVATGILSGAVLAQPAHAQSEPTEMRVVPNSSLPGQAAYGWQYFSDPLAVRAVVISPSGEYFLSLGDGPEQITGPTDQMALAQRAPN